MDNTITEMPHVMTLEEAARFIRVSEKTLGEMARRNRIPSQKVGREWRFLRQALEEWLEGNKSQSPNSRSSVELQRGGEHSPLKQGNLFQKNGFGDTAFTQNRVEPLHRWVPWIAGFSACFVEGVFNTLLASTKKQAAICDPFAGVGTTLVEGLKRGHQALGFEINPYAALACRVKLSSYQFDAPILAMQIQKFLQFMAKAQLQQAAPKSLPPNAFKSRDPFFSPKVEQQVLFVLDFINDQKEPWIRDVFRLALGTVMVSFSNYSYEPSLGRRVSAGKDEIFEADVANIMKQKLEEMESDIRIHQKYLAEHNLRPTFQVFEQSYMENKNPLSPHSLDLIVTSPPYLNNYHYVRNTRPQLFWLGMVEHSVDLKQLEQSSFGKFWQTVRAGPKIELMVQIPELIQVISALDNMNPDRGVYGGRGWANYAASYFNDCARFFDVTKRLMKKGGHVVVVIGNNILQGLEIKTDVFFAAIAEYYGFKTINLHRVRTKRTGSSITNSSVRVGGNIQRAELYETAVEIQAPG